MGEVAGQKGETLAINVNQTSRSFAELVTGVKKRPVQDQAPQLDDTSLLPTVFWTLHENVFQTTRRVFGLITTSKAAEISAYGPFLGRSILELGLTATLGRLDPLRLVALAKYQQNPASFDLGERNQLAVQWTGDLLAKKAKPSDALNEPNNEGGDAPQVKKIDWGKNNLPDKINRSLLGGHLGEFALKAAYLNFQREQLPDDIAPPLLKSITGPDQLIGNFASRADKLFSMWSKGTHAELLMPRDNYFDGDTVVDNLVKTLDLVASLATLCHWSPICAPRLKESELKKARQSVVAAIEGI